MKWYEWIFDGIGTQVLSIVGGIIVCGGGGYLVGRWVKKKIHINQNQKAGNNSRLNQIGNISISNEENSDGDKQTESKSGR